MTDFLQDHPDGQILAADEMSLYLQATLTRLWAARGQAPVVRVSGQRDHVHFYGALNLCNGHEFALPRLEMNSVETAAFLQDLFACYPDPPILLLWDRANWHKGQPVTAVLAAHPRVETVFFPLPVPTSTYRNMSGHWHVPTSVTTTRCLIYLPCATLSFASSATLLSTSTGCQTMPLHFFYVTSETITH